MSLYGMKFRISDYIFFLIFFGFFMFFMGFQLVNEKSIVELAIMTFYFLVPYFVAYNIESSNRNQHTENYEVIVMVFLLLGLNFIIMKLLGFFKVSQYLYMAFCCLLCMPMNNVSTKEQNVENKESKNKTSKQVINITIDKLDFNELKKIPQEELERSMVNCLKNKGFSCMVSRLSQLNLLLSVDNQYSLGFNFLDTPMDIRFIESLARSMQTHNLKLVIISKESYSEEIVNRCMTNGLGIELLIEEDFKNITNYFYRPKYDALGSSFFDLLQSKVLKY